MVSLPLSSNTPLVLLSTQQCALCSVHHWPFLCFHLSGSMRVKPLHKRGENCDYFQLYTSPSPSSNYHAITGVPNHPKSYHWHNSAHKCCLQWCIHIILPEQEHALIRESEVPVSIALSIGVNMWHPSHQLVNHVLWLQSAVARAHCYSITSINELSTASHSS